MHCKSTYNDVKNRETLYNTIFQLGCKRWGTQEKTERSDKDNIHTHTRDRKYQNNKKKQDRDRKAQPVALRLSSKLLSWSEGKLFNSSKDFLNSVESHRQVTR